MVSPQIHFDPAEIAGGTADVAADPVASGGTVTWDAVEAL